MSCNNIIALDKVETKYSYKDIQGNNIVVNSHFVDHISNFDLRDIVVFQDFFSSDKKKN